MQRDALACLVDLPQPLEQEFGLHPRVDEHEAEPVPATDLGVNIANRVHGAMMSGPGQGRPGCRAFAGPGGGLARLAVTINGAAWRSGGANQPPERAGRAPLPTVRP
jgi:hypothetical protein